MIAQLVLWHLGGLHPFEKALTFGLAFGPFLVLFAVIAVRRRQDQAAERAEQAGQTEVSAPATTPDPSGPPSSTP